MESSRFTKSHAFRYAKISKESKKIIILDLSRLKFHCQLQQGPNFIFFFSMALDIPLRQKLGGLFSDTN